MNQADSSQCIAIINKDLGLDQEESLPLPNSATDQHLEENLTKVIQYLINTDFSRLVNAMYRIDIPENEFKLTLETSDPDFLANEIAKKVIARALQKLEIRKKYSSK